MNRLMTFVGVLFEQHKLARRLLLLWAICLITYCVVSVFDNIASITPPVSDFLGRVVTLLAIVLPFYQWSRGRDAKP